MDDGPLLLGELRELVLHHAADLSAVALRSMARFDGLRRLRVLELEGAVALTGPLLTSETALKAMELTPGPATAMAALEAKARKAEGATGDEYDGGEHEVTGPTAADLAARVAAAAAAAVAEYAQVPAELASIGRAKVLSDQAKLAAEEAAKLTFQQEAREMQYAGEEKGYGYGPLATLLQTVGPSLHTLKLSGIVVTDR